VMAMLDAANTFPQDVPKDAEMVTALEEALISHRWANPPTDPSLPSMKAARVVKALRMAAKLDAAAPGCEDRHFLRAALANSHVREMADYDAKNVCLNIVNVLGKCGIPDRKAEVLMDLLDSGLPEQAGGGTGYFYGWSSSFAQDLRQ